MTSLSRPAIRKILEEGQLQELSLQLYDAIIMPDRRWQFNYLVENHPDAIKKIIGLRVFYGTFNNVPWVHAAVPVEDRDDVELLPIMKFILSVIPEAVNDVHLTGGTPLMETCLRGHPNMAKLLLDHGAQIDWLNHWHQTPLMHTICVGRRSLPVIQLLLERGADPCFCNKFGETALSLVRAKRVISTEIVELVEKYAAVY